MSLKQTLLHHNYTHKTARGVRAILLTPSMLATFDDSIATYSTSMTIPWLGYTPGLPVNYSRDTARQFYCYKVRQFRGCLRMILPIFFDNSMDTLLTILRVSYESADFGRTSHCFVPQCAESGQLVIFAFLCSTKQ